MLYVRLHLIVWLLSVESSFIEEVIAVLAR
jgi:hypothetical protein